MLDFEFQDDDKLNHNLGLDFALLDFSRTTSFQSHRNTTQEYRCENFSENTGWFQETRSNSPPRTPPESAKGSLPNDIHVPFTEGFPLLSMSESTHLLSGFPDARVMPARYLNSDRMSPPSTPTCPRCDPLPICLCDKSDPYNFSFQDYPERISKHLYQSPPPPPKPAAKKCCSPPLPPSPNSTDEGNPEYKDLQVDESASERKSLRNEMEIVTDGELDTWAWISMRIEARALRKPVEAREQWEEAHLNCPVLVCRHRATHQKRMYVTSTPENDILGNDHRNMNLRKEEQGISKEEIHRNCPLKNCEYKRGFGGEEAPSFSGISMDFDGGSGKGDDL
ncbi:hypothetical protein G7Y89_g5972 [Cudoniella acicularis]|uniref:Uncharacterized protein n=1 Tax=Cudoniella acicularis TaxID=354080 RepID=A0A8H4RPQ2_9HELO|nr:hypothetical protein G7Y89_g5972 [Cudoniella acicularis]